MKKQIGLFALVTLVISFVAFSGVASAQASNVTMSFFTSPMCSVCQKVEPQAQAAAAKYGVNMVVYDVSSTQGKAIAQANSVSETPTIIITGAQPARLTGDVSQAQIEAAIKAAIGSSTPTPAATAKPVVKAAATAKPVVKAAATAKPVVKAAATATPEPTKAKQTVAQPAIQVVTTTPTQTTATKTVPEFSLIGLGAPALVVGALYLFLRRR